jgi:membrane-bound lytic murein transglycosylase F
MIEKWKLNRTAFLSTLLTFVILFSCTNNFQKTATPPISEHSALDDILQKGRLTAVTDLGSTSYFIFRGEPMGYQFDLLRAFSDHLGVKLEIFADNDPESAMEKLNAGQYDLIAKGLTITHSRREKVAFSDPMMHTRQVLIQRKPGNWRRMNTWDEVESQLIRNPADLAGKTIYLQRNTAFYDRLVHLQKEIGADINIIEVADHDTEDLIAMVARGEIDYTVGDEHIALVSSKYYTDLDIQTPISLTQNIAWAVRRGNDDLLDALNQWWLEFGQSRYADLLYARYFDNQRGLHAGQREFHSRKGGRISNYDEVIRKYSKYIDWDWRLLASLIYQESRFRHEAVSHAGAFGIMQIMPATAIELGIDLNATPIEQIEAGVKYLRWLDKQFATDIPDTAERQKFVLAAYNAGIAHVFDARRLAAKNNKNPNIWEGHVDYYLLNKSKPEYYLDEVVYYGYCRGQEPYNYVTEILDRYGHYQRAIRN